MKSWFGCVSLVLLIVMGSCVFVTAQRMHQAQLDLQTFKRQIAQEQDSLRVLQAEWTYLNNPERLEKLAAELGLQPLDGRQYVAVNTIPTTANMQTLELAQADHKTDTQNTVRQQQWAAAAQPVDAPKVERALALAAAETSPQAGLPSNAPALPVAVNVALTADGVE